MKKENIRRATLEQLKEMKARGEFLRPTEKSENFPIASNDDEDFETTLPDDFWENAVLVYPETKASVHLRVDRKVLDFFKSQGKGHLTRMNAVLRAYVEANEKAKKAG